MGSNWISVPVGRSGVRVGSSWGNGSNSGPGAALLAFFLAIVAFIFIGFWLAVAATAFLFFRGLWRLAHGDWGVAAFWIFLSMALGFGEVQVYRWWDQEMERTRQEEVAKKAGCLKAGGFWESDRSCIMLSPEDTKEQIARNRCDAVSGYWSNNRCVDGHDGAAISPPALPDEPAPQNR
jgi:hypothetical protein